MTKKQLLTLLTVSALALSKAGVISADEVVPVDPSAPSTEVVVPPTDSTPLATDTGSSDTGTTQPTVPVDSSTPTTPITPTEPSTSTDPSTSDPVVPTNPSTPGTSTEPSDNNGNNGNPTTPEPEKPQPNKPTPAPKPPAPMPEPNQTFDPFETNGGQTVVGTQNSQVVVQQADGSTNLVSAESIGGKTNADGTVTLTSASGEIKNLPETGEEAFISSLLSLIGLSLLAVGTKLKKLF